MAQGDVGPTKGNCHYTPSCVSTGGSFAIVPIISGGRQSIELSAVGDAICRRQLKIERLPAAFPESFGETGGVDSQRGDGGLGQRKAVHVERRSIGLG